MKGVFPVLFTETTDGTILIEVPDLEILTQGHNFNDAIQMARDAIEVKCVSMEDMGETIPEPSKISNISIENGIFANEGKTITSLIDIDSTEYRRKIDTKTIRRNVTLPSWLNYEAEHSGVNVSRVLQEALIKVLGVENRI